MFGKKSVKINAILDKDIEALLRESQQYESLINGEIKCLCCQTTITVGNIGIILPFKKDNQILLGFYCERIDCTENYKEDNG